MIGIRNWLTFCPLLHLSNSNKLWLEQEGYYSEIYLYLYDKFKEEFPDHDIELKELEEELKEELEHEVSRLEKKAGKPN